MAIRIGRRLIEKDDEGDRARKVDLASLAPMPQPMDMRREAKAEPTLSQRIENLEHILHTFARHTALAREAAGNYEICYREILTAIENQRGEIETRTEHLDKIEAQLPTIGGKDEKDSSDSAASADVDTDPSKDELFGGPHQERD